MIDSLSCNKQCGRYVKYRQWYPLGYYRHDRESNDGCTKYGSDYWDARFSSGGYQYSWADGWSSDFSWDSWGWSAPSSPGYGGYPTPQPVSDYYDSTEEPEDWDFLNTEEPDNTYSPGGGWWGWYSNTPEPTEELTCDFDETTDDWEYSDLIQPVGCYPQDNDDDESSIYISCTSESITFSFYNSNDDCSGEPDREVTLENEECQIFDEQPMIIKVSDCQTAPPTKEPTPEPTGVVSLDTSSGWMYCNVMVFVLACIMVLQMN